MRIEVLSFATDDFQCIVRADKTKIKGRQTALLSVLQKRGKGILPRSSFKFAQPVVFQNYDSLFEQVFFPKNLLQKNLSILSPIFFENTSYEIEIVFSESVTSCNPKHHLNRIQENISSRLKQISQEQVWFRASLDFRNDLGWFALPFSYVKDGKTIEQTVSFEVWPFKMDMERDLTAIYDVLDKAHPLLRFSWKSVTEQGFNRSKLQHEPFELLWLAEFKSLNEQMQKSYKQVLSAPHNRLLSNKVFLRADRMKGKLANKLSEKVRGDIKSGIANKRYGINQKQLSVNTPENQFIKYALDSISNKLDQIKLKISKSDEATAVFTAAFYHSFDEMALPYKKFKTFPLFKEVGDFKGLKSESLVLQQKSGYSSIYQAWQKLKYYLGILGDDASISVKNIAELYEVWCFLQLADILQNEFGFSQEGINPRLVGFDETSLEYGFESGKNGFVFSRGDGEHKIQIELKHEFSIGSKNKFARKKENSYVAWMAEHKPDIFMKVKFSDEREYIWLFDAKYRIDEDSSGKDMVPVDALAQMHRYRDAIIYRKDSKLSRPVYGAYALYPGYFENQETEQNPYSEAVEEIDIGAFPFLPGGVSTANNKWLVDFLAKRMGITARNGVDSKVGETGLSYELSMDSTHLDELKSAKILPTNFVHTAGN